MDDAIDFLHAPSNTLIRYYLAVCQKYKYLLQYISLHLCDDCVMKGKCQFYILAGKVGRLFRCSAQA